MKNVLVTATTFPRWKNDTEPGFVFTLSNMLAKKGFNVVVLVPHCYNAKKFEIMGNLRVYRFSYFYPASLQKLCYEGGILENLKKSFLAKIQVPFLLISEYFNVLRVIKKEKIDFIHAHWILPQGFLAAIIKKFYKIPYIATAHAGDIFPIKKGVLKNFAKSAIDNASQITANSNFTKNSILKISSSKISIIPMGVDFKDFNSIEKDHNLKKKYENNNIILFVGRLVEKKGVEYLIKTMPIVLKSIPNSKLLIIGDGPEMRKLIKLAEELNLEKNVIFVGKIRNQDLPKYYATADVFVGPSIVTKKGDTEGLGVVFLEAIASGTCVVGSNVGGIPDIIKQNKTGLLVEQKNIVELANAIIDLLKNRKLRERLSKNAIKHIKNLYSWNLVAEKFFQIYSKIK